MCMNGEQDELDKNYGFFPWSVIPKSSFGHLFIQTLQRVDGLFISFSFFREKLHDMYSRHFSVFPACRDF